MWSRLSFLFALLVVLVTGPFLLPLIYGAKCIRDWWNDR